MGQKAVRKRSKTDRITHQTDTIHEETDTIHEETDWNLEKTDTFFGREDHANRMSAAGPGVFLFSSRLLASTSLIGSLSPGGKSSYVVTS